MAVWECPGCHRRVPDRIAVCHCGTRRDEVPPAAPARERPARPAVPMRVPPPPRVRPSARDERDESALFIVLRGSWHYLVLFILALAGATVWGVRWEPETFPPLLGRPMFERPSPRPDPPAPPSPSVPPSS